LAIVRMPWGRKPTRLSGVRAKKKPRRSGASRFATLQFGQLHTRRFGSCAGGRPLLHRRLIFTPHPPRPQASASPNDDPNSRRSHGRCGLSLGLVSLFLRAWNWLVWKWRAAASRAAPSNEVVLDCCLSACACTAVTKTVSANAIAGAALMWPPLLTKSGDCVRPAIIPVAGAGE